MEPAEVAMTDKGRWVCDQIKAMRREGLSRHEITHEVNRLLYGKASCPDCEAAP
jgi:glutaredoxin